MSLSVDRREMLRGSEAKVQGALLITVTVSVLSGEDSPICPNLASMLFFFQIHEVKGSLFPQQAVRCVILQPIHPRRDGMGEAGIWAGPLSQFSFLNPSSPTPPITPRAPQPWLGK